MIIIWNSIMERFSKVNKMLQAVDTDSISSCVAKLVNLYPNDINSLLGNKCIHFRSFVPTETLFGSKKRKVNAKDLIQIIRSKNLESTFPNIDVVLRIFLSTADTNCSRERSFNTLKWIKSALRSTIGQERMSALSILHIES